MKKNIMVPKYQKHRSNDQEKMKRKTKVASFGMSDAYG